MRPARKFRRGRGVVSHTINSQSEIPDAYAYVLTNDNFFSGWGPARDLINTIILPCESWEEAEQVAAYAESRPEQRRVRITAKKPVLRPGHLYSLLVRSEASAWFPPAGSPMPSARTFVVWQGGAA